jgi:glycosyltransferase involved in cell wall biosynthesis
MKVALVVTGGLHPSGTEEVIPLLLTLIERLSQWHEVHAFSVRHLPTPRSYPLSGATVHDLGRPAGLWAQWRALARALRRHGPFDIVHGYWIDPAGLLASIAGRRFGIPSVVTCSSGEFVHLPAIDYGQLRTPKGRAAVSVTCRLATCVHVTTDYMAAAARAQGCDSVMVPLGIDVQAAIVERPPGPPWRLLQVASLSPVKDQMTLLRAVARVRQHADVRLDLVGEDTLGGRVQKEAADLGLNDAVTFHGFVRNADLRGFHDAAHVYVQSSLHEASGIAVLEAAAAGVPIVGTRVGFVHDWAPQSACAVAPGDHESLAAAILRLVQHGDERARLGAAARARATEYDADWSARAISDLYTSLVPTSARGERRSEHTQR